MERGSNKASPKKSPKKASPQERENDFEETRNIPTKREIEQINSLLKKLNKLYTEDWWVEDKTIAPYLLTMKDVERMRDYTVWVIEPQMYENIKEFDGYLFYFYDRYDGKAITSDGTWFIYRDGLVEAMEALFVKITTKASPKKKTPVKKDPKASPKKKATPKKKASPKKKATPKKKASPVKKATPKKKASPVKKKCPPGKIENPATKRCVSKTGKIGKTLGSSPKKSQPKKSPPKKKCPPGKIENPATGKCVLRNGKIGKTIPSPKKSSEKKTSPVKKSASKKASEKKCPPGKILNPASGKCVLRTGKIGKKLV